MKGYRFKLEALQRFRCFEEERLQKELADAQRVLEQAVERLNGQVTLQKKTEIDFQKQQSQLTTGPQAAMYRCFLKQLSVLIIDQQDKVQAARTMCDQRRGALLEAVKKRKVIDRLREKELQAYLENLNREEVKFIDEMAINRFSFHQR